MDIPGLDLKPKDAVRRILEAAGVELPDRDAYWMGVHMERFVSHTRLHGEQLDLPVAVEGYLAFYMKGAPADWQVAQVKQALTFFARGIERWRWVKAEEGDRGGGGLQPGPQGWVLRYRVKTSGVNQALVSAKNEVSPAGPPAEMDTWLDALRRAVRVNHYSIRTEQSYLEQVRRFLMYTGPAEHLGEEHVQRYLEHLAVGRRVAASTQNQAFSALLFFFKRVLARPLGDLEATARAHRGRRLPEVLSREEVRRFLAQTEGSSGLMLRLLYGAGLRLMECIRLRVKEVDFERGLILVRDGKGGKDRSVMLPEAARAGLTQHFERLRVLWEQDREADRDGVWLPDALERKYPNGG